MTSFAFILGVVPLVVATGAGAASRISLGTSVFGGMLAGTLLVIFFVPVFFVSILGFSERKISDTSTTRDHEKDSELGSHHPFHDPQSQGDAIVPSEEGPKL